MPQLTGMEKASVVAMIKKLDQEISISDLIHRQKRRRIVECTLHSFDNPLVKDIAEKYSGEITENEMCFYCDDLLGC